MLPNAIVLPVVIVDDNDSFAPSFNTSFCFAICFRNRIALSKIAITSATIIILSTELKINMMANKLTIGIKLMINDGTSLFNTSSLLSTFSSFT